MSQDYITRIPTRPCRRHIHTYSTFSRIRSLAPSFWTLVRFLRQLKTTLRKVMEMVVRRRGCAVSVEQRRGERRDQRSTALWPGRAEESRESCSVILARTESSYYHVQLLFSPGPGRSHQPLALKLTFQLPPWVRGERTRAVTSTLTSQPPHWPQPDLAGVAISPLRFNSSLTY